MSDSIHVSLIDTPIRPEDWYDQIADPDTGAHAWFSGVTRQTTRDASGNATITRSLFFEAHRVMALAQLQAIAQQAKTQYQLSGIVIVHRLGDVPIGESSVLMGCSSAHRKDAFAALPWMMDRLKEDVPIWKRETFEDESTKWVHPPSPSSDDAGAP